MIITHRTCGTEMEWVDYGENAQESIWKCPHCHEELLISYEERGVYDMAGNKVGSITVRENDKFVTNGTVWENEKNGKKFKTVSINVERVEKLILKAKLENREWVSIGFLN